MDEKICQNYVHHTLSNQNAITADLGESPKSQAKNLRIGITKHHLAKQLFSPILPRPECILRYLVVHRSEVMKVAQLDGCEFSFESRSPTRVQGPPSPAAIRCTFPARKRLSTLLRRNGVELGWENGCRNIGTAAQSSARGGAAHNRHFPSQHLAV